VPTNGSIFFTIFQTFMSGKEKEGKSIPRILNLANTQKTILILSLLTSATEEEQMMKETGEVF
jgi:hypothetical protein